MHRFTSTNLSRRAALLVAGTLSFSKTAIAAEPRINTLTNSIFSSRTDTAINGYDTVAYITLNKPVKGLDSLVHEWMGAKWKFSTQAHLDLFKARPEKYAPQYGGYCAYGVTKGGLVKVDPAQFAVHDGRLYLNYDADTQAKWKKDIPGYVKLADERFESLFK